MLNNWEAGHFSTSDFNSAECTGSYFGWSEIDVNTNNDGAEGENVLSLPEEIICSENWECTSWSACQNNSKTRTCVDSNNCGTVEDKPVESQSCQGDAWCEDDGKTVTFFVPTYPQAQTESDRCEGIKTYTNVYCVGTAISHTFNNRCPDGQVCSNAECIPETTPTQYGVFSISTNMAGATVKLDGVAVGTTYQLGGSGTYYGYLTSDIPIKQYYIELSKAGCSTNGGNYTNIADKVVGIDINIQC